jgi:hypothetical protein
MEREHEVAGLALKTIHRLTDGFRPPGAIGLVLLPAFYF